LLRLDITRDVLVEYLFAVGIGLDIRVLLSVDVPDSADSLSPVWEKGAPRIAVCGAPRSIGGEVPSALPRVSVPHGGFEMVAVGTMSRKPDRPRSTGNSPESTARKFFTPARRLNSEPQRFYVRQRHDAHVIQTVIVMRGFIGDTVPT
jgi:hypothetical protein